MSATDNKPTFTFLKDMSEARLIGGSVSGLGKYNARDLADLLLLYLAAINILKHDFYGLPKVQRYIASTGNLVNFDYFSPARNDLYLLIHVLTGRNNERAVSKLKDMEASQELIDSIRLSSQELKRYLRMAMTGVKDESFERRFLLLAERQLQVSNSYYRSIRRLASTWATQPESTKRVVMTRLLQILRSKFRRSELLPFLEEVSKKQGLHDKEIAKTELESEKNRKQSSISTALGVGAASFGAGLAGGYALTRKRK